MNYSSLAIELLEKNFLCRRYSMQLKVGVQFTIVQDGETWELRNQNKEGGWVCRRVQPLCSNHHCPLQTFKVFYPGSIWDHIVVDPTDPQRKWLGLLEVEILTMIESRTRALNSQQKRTLLLAIQKDLDQRAFILGDAPSERVTAPPNPPLKK